MAQDRKRRKRNRPGRQEPITRRGGMMGMRSGFRNMVGASGGRNARGNAFVTWLVIAVVMIVLVLWFTRG